MIIITKIKCLSAKVRNDLQSASEKNNNDTPKIDNLTQANGWYLHRIKL